MIDYIVGLDFKLYLVFCALKQVREVSIVITRIKYLYMVEFEYLLICSKSGVKSKRLYWGNPLKSSAAYHNWCISCLTCFSTKIKYSFLAILNFKVVRENNTLTLYIWSLRVTYFCYHCLTGRFILSTNKSYRVILLDQ